MGTLRFRSRDRKQSNVFSPHRFSTDRGDSEASETERRYNRLAGGCHETNSELAGGIGCEDLTGNRLGPALLASGFRAAESGASGMHGGFYLCSQR